jgi:hypothetical protein
VYTISSCSDQRPILNSAAFMPKTLVQNDRGSLNRVRCIGSSDMGADVTHKDDGDNCEEHDRSTLLQSFLGLRSSSFG